MSFNFKTNVQYDFPDNRDWIYRPALVKLKPSIDCPEGLFIRNQGKEGACTGFALAAAIDLLKKQASNTDDFKASVRMLYEMARRHDEWAGEEYSGSSLRSAIHGWKHMGVCEEKEWKYYRTPGRAGHLTVERAKKARLNTIGAYYRLRPRIADMHAAINETGVVIVSARIHAGWRKCQGPKIEKHSFVNGDGGHAFTVVGYNESGFWVQNSWGENWGDRGLSLWSYPDWIENVMDAWVFRLALSTPSIFGMHPMQSRLRPYVEAKEGLLSAVGMKIKRREIAGHFIHVDEGAFAGKGQYWSDQEDVQETVKLLAGRDYKHVVMFAHGGLASPAECANQIAAMKDTFKQNSIYPYHILYDTGITHELLQLIDNRDHCADLRSELNMERRDEVMEYLSQRTGHMLWREMKNNACEAFTEQAPGTFALKAFFHLMMNRDREKMIRFHLIAHGSGAVLIGYLLRALMRYKVRVDSISLLAPACTHSFYAKYYQPAMDHRGKLRVEQMHVYQLLDLLERNSGIKPGLAYRKSLLHLVSQSFENEASAPLLGMSRFNQQLKANEHGPIFHLSDGINGEMTRARSHDGFAHDAMTLNHVLNTILSESPKVLFS